MSKRYNRQGFTLIEIMVVVAIIGILAAIATPRMMYANRRTHATRISKEMKNAAQAFTRYALENGKYPADNGPAQIPDGMTAYLEKFPWSEETIIGGQWDWDQGVFGVTAGISVHAPNWDSLSMIEVDKTIDDGNLGTGQFRSRAGGYIYIIEE